jgi:hypothetical protein
MPTQVYRKPNDPNIYEVGTDRVIGATEFGIGTPTVGRNFSQVTQPTPPVNPTPPTPVQKQPEVIRDGAGVAVKTPFSDFVNTSKLMESAKELLLRKQNMNKDINDAATYWRGVYSDPASFGANTADRIGAYKDPNDVIFRQLSPADQANIRIGRSNTAAANLKTIQDERVYRGNIMKDVLANLKDTIAEQKAAATDKTNYEGRMWDNAKKRLEMTGMVDANKDLEMSPDEGIGDRVGKSDSWRHNNAGMLLYNDETARYGATKGMSAGDGKFYAVFPDEQTGKEVLRNMVLTGAELPGAVKNVMSKKEYQYAAENPEEWTKAYEDIKKANKWEEGKYLSASSVAHVFWTPAKIEAFSRLDGRSPSVLVRMTDDDLSAAYQGYKNDLAKQIVREFTPTIERDLIVKNGVTPDVSEVIINGILNGIDTDPDFIAVLEEQGIKDVATKINAVKTSMEKNDALSKKLASFLLLGMNQASTTEAPAETPAQTTVGGEGL